MYYLFDTNKFAPTIKTFAHGHILSARGIPAPVQCSYSKNDRHVQRRIHNKLEAGHPQSSRASARNGHLKTADYGASSLSTAGDWNSKPKVFHRVFDFDLTRNRNAPHPSHAVLDSGELARYLVCCDYDQIVAQPNNDTAARVPLAPTRSHAQACLAPTRNENTPTRSAVRHMAKKPYGAITQLVHSRVREHQTHQHKTTTLDG